MGHIVLTRGNFTEILEHLSYGICLSAVDRRVIISADDVAHRTGEKGRMGQAGFVKSNE